MSSSKQSSWILLPILSGFFIMGAPAGIISTAKERIRADFQNATVLADALPFMAFVLLACLAYLLVLGLFAARRVWTKA